MHAHFSVVPAMGTTAYLLVLGLISYFYCRIVHIIENLLICPVMSIAIQTTIVFLLSVDCNLSAPPHPESLVRNVQMPYVTAM